MKKQKFPKTYRALATRYYKLSVELFHNPGQPDLWREVTRLARELERRLHKMTPAQRQKLEDA